jgi:hypothetical protein
MVRRDQLSRWADIAKIAGTIISLVTLLFGGNLFYSEVWNVSDLRYTVLPASDMEAAPFSGLVVENRGRVPAHEIEIILAGLEYDIQDLQMPGPHEKANTTWNPGNPTNSARIEMERLSPGLPLSIYIRTSGPVTLAEGRTFTVVSDRGKAGPSLKVVKVLVAQVVVDPLSFWIGIAVAIAGIVGVAFVVVVINWVFSGLSKMWQPQVVKHTTDKTPLRS